ncbi:MAG TPA: Gfo/Idh/MocA family oxidoreductase [Actinomycetes bacterium]|nr:Gfo/Idh/MocA family oxidoreductase [Actinomycetes bacterium]
MRCRRCALGRAHAHHATDLLGRPALHIAQDDDRLPGWGQGGNGLRQARAGLGGQHALLGQVLPPLRKGHPVPRPGLRRVEPLGRHRRLVIPRAYADVDPMLAAEQPDLVHIATPPHTHVDLTIRCPQAGAWVLCEKPLCGTLADLDRMATLTSSICSNRPECSDGLPREPHGRGGPLLGRKRTSPC